MEDEALSPVIGTILLVAITVTMAGVVFLVMDEQTETVEETPRVAFHQENSGPGGSLTVAAVDGLVGAIDWSQVQMAPSSTATCTLPTGALNAGDRIACGSEGTVVLSYRLPSGDTVLIFQGEVR